MTDEQLIQLLADQLPEDLTVEQIDLLRERIRDSDAVRDALLAELQLEEALAAHHAPPSHDFQQLLEKVDAITQADDLHGRPVRAWPFLAALLLIIGIGIAVVIFLPAPDPDPDPIAVLPAEPSNPTNPADDENTQVIENDPDPQPDPAGTDQDDAKPQNGDKPENENTDAETDRLLEILPAHRLHDYDWRNQSERWMSRVRTILDGRRFDHKGDYFELDGTYRLKPTLKEGRMLRLAFSDEKRLTLEIWSGREGVLLSLYDDRIIAEKVLAADDQRKRIEVREYLGDAGGIWEMEREGALDLRYQEGSVVLASGERVHHVIPLAEEPDQVIFDAQGRLRLRLLEWRAVNPIELPESPSWSARWGAYAPPTPISPVNRWVWQIEMSERDREADEDRAEIEVDEQAGTLIFSVKQTQDPVYFWTALPGGSGIQASVRIEEADRGVRVGLADDRFNSDEPIEFTEGPKTKRLIATHRPGDKRQNEQDEQRGYFADQPFDLAFSRMLDHSDIAYRPAAGPWRSIRSKSSDSNHRRFFVQIPPGDGTRRVRLSLGAIKQLGAMERLFPPATEALNWDESRRYRSLDDLFAHTAAFRPDHIPLDVWQQWYAVRALEAGDSRDLRRLAAGYLIDEAIQKNRPYDQIVGALQEMPVRVALGWRAAGEDWDRLREQFDQLALREHHAGRSEHLTDLLAVWYALPGGISDYPNSQITMPLQLGRLVLLDAWQNGSDQNLRRQAKRMLYHATWGNGELRNDRQDRDLISLARWAERVATNRIGDQPIGETAPIPIDWSHPLIVEADRTTLNTFAEFVAAVEVGAYEQALTLLTRHDLPDGIAPVGQGERLFQSIHLRTLQLLKETPEMLTLLKREYAGIGELRLQRAREARDPIALQGIATQFFGTKAGRDALESLADRDLAMGNFFVAVNRYRSLLTNYDLGPAAHDIRGKLRLAAAMVGQSVGAPMTQPITLSGGVLEPAQFEAMIQDLIVRHQSGAASLDGGRGTMEGPGFGEVTPRSLGSFQSGRDDRTRELGRMTGWVSSDRWLILNAHGRISGFDLREGKQKWSHEQRFNDDRTRQYPATPTIVGDRVFARMPAGRRDQIVALSLEEGKVLWQREYDQGFITDPLVVGSWVYVLTWRPGLGESIEIILRRLSMTDGQSAQETRLINLRDDRENRQAPKPIISDSSLLITVGNTVLSCDLLGELQWVRRLSYLPRDAAPQLWEDRIWSTPLIAGDRLVISPPGSPHLTCIDLVSGREVWQRLIPDLRHLIGISGDRLFFTSEQNVHALNLSDGEQVWHHLQAARPQAILPAAGYALLALHFDENTPALRWYDAANHQLISDQPFTTSDHSDPAVIFSDGQRIFALTNLRSNNNEAKLLELTIESK